MRNAISGTERLAYAQTPFKGTAIASGVAIHDANAKKPQRTLAMAKTLWRAPFLAGRSRPPRIHSTTNLALANQLSACLIKILVKKKLQMTTCVLIPDGDINVEQIDKYHRLSRCTHEWLWRVPSADPARRISLRATRVVSMQKQLLL